MTSTPNIPTPTAGTASMPTPRLAALDALRGFDMFWLIGGELLPAALLTWTGWPLWQTVSQQFEHSDWHGFRFYDLIFPLFIFIAGVALGLQGNVLASLPPQQRRPYYVRAARRLLLLLVLGVVYNHGWGSGLPADLAKIRYASVLGRIGMAWFAAAMLVWHVRARTVVWLTAGLLLAYSCLQCLWPLTADGSINALLDQAWLPGRTYRNAPYDPEGIFSQWGAVTNCLIGALVGMYWRAQPVGIRRLPLLAGAAVAMVLAACLLHPVYPLNKPLWTGSFVLLTCGLSLGLLLFFDALLGKGQPRWSLPFHWLGQNAVLAYLGTSLMAWSYTVRSLTGGWIAASPTSLRPLLSALCLLLLQFVILRWLYRRKIFLRL